jgi:soluble lytic murein transglycosylase-like protein
MFDAAGRQYNINPDLLRAVAQVESNFRANAVSRAGAMGIMQIMPATARHLGVTDPFDPLQSIMGGARYIREQLDRFNGDIRLALASYNAGWPAVQRHGGIPPFRETRAYVSRVMNLFGDRDITAGIHAHSNNENARLDNPFVEGY